MYVTDWQSVFCTSGYAKAWQPYAMDKCMACRHYKSQWPLKGQGLWQECIFLPATIRVCLVHEAVHNYIDDGLQAAML